MPLLMHADLSRLFLPPKLPKFSKRRIIFNSCVNQVESKSQPIVVIQMLWLKREKTRVVDFRMSIKISLAIEGLQ